MMKLTLAKFRVKIKSLAEEARIIRDQERQAKTDSDRGHLRHHRVTVVRKEQRSTLLAYSYLRGKPYRSVEQKSAKEVDLKAVERILRSLASVLDSDVIGWTTGESNCPGQLRSHTDSSGKFTENV